MIKIYINEIPLILTTSEDAQNYQPSTKTNLLTRYSGQRRSIFHFIDNLEKNTRFESIVLHSNDLEQLISDFFSIYKVIEAGGGVVFNDKKDILMIYRLGHWDLPKGKIEKGESREEAAIREVQEETGIQNIELKKKLHTTYHTYRNRKDKRCLKVTYWYVMQTIDTELTPQHEEDIEKAVWMKKDTVLEQKEKAYRNIIDILNLV